VDELGLCAFHRGHHIVRLFYIEGARKVTLGDEIFDLEADSVLDWGEFNVKGRLGFISL
jgi:hypothetical protein